MDWLTFIAKLIEILVWPAVVLTAILLLRKPLGEWVLTLTSMKLKWNDWEGEFSRGLAEAKETAERIEESTTTTTTTTTTAPPDYEPASEKYRRLIDVSPTAGITEAWRDIEIELATAGRKCGLPTNLPPHQLIRTVSDYVHMDQAMLDLLYHLRTLKNEAVHGRTEVSPTQASEYAELAVRVLTRLRALTGG